MPARLLINPRAAQPSESFLQKIRQEERLESHLLFQTSGSSGEAKWVALSAHALETSARACNEHVQASERDVFVLALPDFHVGGYGLRERARVASARLANFQEHGKWQPAAFHEFLRKAGATITSLVPAQVFDLVRARLAAPPTLRAIVVGGGALPPSLYGAARKLAWPLLPSYGLTECASQVATAPLESLQSNEAPRAQLLSHMRAEEIGGDRVRVRSAALLSYYVRLHGELLELSDPKIDGAFELPDRVHLRGREVEVHGRREEDYKILGEWIRWDLLKKKFHELCYTQDLFLKFEIVLLPDERKGNMIALRCESFDQDAKALVEKFNQGVFPFEKITHAFVAPLERSELGKILPAKINPICLQEISV